MIIHVAVNKTVDAAFMYAQQSAVGATKHATHIATKLPSIVSAIATTYYTAN